MTAATLWAGDYAYTTNGGLVTITGYSGPGGDVVIPSEIEGLPVGVIATNAFAGRSTLTSVVIPDSVTTVDCGAFRDCSALADVTVGREIFSIGREAFYGCSGMTNVTLRGLPRQYVEWDGVPNGPPFTLWCALDSPSYSITVEEGVTEIYEEAFAMCHGLRSVVLPQELTDIGHNAFYDCPMLGGIVIPPGVTNIGRAAFAVCTALASANIPDGVCSIGVRAFAYCGLQGALVLPDGVRSVGSEAFRDCGGLTDVTVGRGIATMGTEAFFGCGALTNITFRGLPELILNEFGEPVMPSLYYVFDSPSYAAVIAEGVAEIQAHAFEGCAGLTRISLPSSLAQINTPAFGACCQLESFAVDGANPRYYSLSGVLLDRAERALAQCPMRKAGDFTVPADVTRIADSAFGGCAWMDGLYFKGDAPALGESVFSGTDSLIAYRLPAASGWGETLGGIPVVLWNPQVQAGTAFGLSAEGFVFAIGNAGAATVVIEACTNLVDAAWATVGVMSGGTNTFCDPLWRYYPSRYYRLSMP